MSINITEKAKEQLKMQIQRDPNLLFRIMVKGFG